MELLDKDLNLPVKDMNKNFKKMIGKVNRLLLIILTVQLFCYYCGGVARASEYASLIDAIQDTTTPRTYTLDETEVSSTVLGNIGRWNSVLTINGGTGNYGIDNTSTAPDTRLFVNKNQTVYLQNLGTYTTTTSSSIVDGVDIITDVTVGNSVNNFGLTSDRVGFLRSAGTSHISNSVFYNNRGKFGAALQNRENGTMSITGSVFVENSSPQGTVHNDGINNITQISDSIFYNNTATAQTSGDTDLINRSGSAIYNKPERTIDIISGSQFVGNNTISTAEGQQTGTIYNGGIIGEISNSVFYNNNNQRGSVINNISGSTVTTISDSTFVQNSATGSGAALLNASGSTIGTITDSLFTSNTATSDGGAIYNAGTITDLAGTYTSNSATANGGAINNVGTIIALAGTYTSNQAANGGAIYNTGTINDLSGTYTSNSATADGGAIYNTGTATITSSLGADTLFSGNQANSISNALYNSGTVNLHAGANSFITFDDKIAGLNGALVLDGDGIVEFNDTVTGNSVTLNSGTLKLGAADSIQNVTNFTANGGMLDLRNNAVGNYQLGQGTTINGTVALAIDVNLAGATPVSDMITANGAGSVSGTGSFVFSSANIHLINYADTKIPLWVQVTDEYLRNNAGLGSNANITITSNAPESYLITYETSHEGINAGFLKFEHDTLANAIASAVTEKAYTMGSNDVLASTPALGGTHLTINGNTAGYSITGDTGTGIAVGNDQTLSVNNIGIDSSGNVTGAGFNNFSTALTNAGDGTINLYNTKFSGNTTDIDNDGTVNMSGTVIFDNVQGTGTLNVTKDSSDNASSVTVNNSLEQNNITIESENTLTNNNATITANANLNNAGTITGTGTSSLVINGDSANTGTIEQGTVTTAASATLTNNGTITVNNTLNNNGAIVGDYGVLNINATTTNAGTIEQGTLLTDDGITLTNTGDITVKTTLTNNGTMDNNNHLTLAGTSMTNAGTISGTGTTDITETVTNSGTISQKEINVSGSGQLTSHAGTLTATDGITNDGTLELTGGNIASEILGTSGTTHIAGNVTNSANHSIANTVDVETGATLTTGASALLNTTNNDGTLELTGGTVGSDIAGSGVVEIASSVQNAADITQNSITVHNGQTLTNNSGAGITTTDTVAGAGFQNNGIVLNSGSISAAGGSNTGSITGDGTFTNSGNLTNSNTISQHVITNNGTINTNSENLIAQSGIINNGTLVYNAGSKTVSDITGDGSANSHVELRVNAPFTIDNTISNTYVDLYNSTLRFGNSGDISGATAFNVNGGAMDLIDGSITSTDLGTVNLNAPSSIGIDLDLSTLTSDSFSAIVNNNGGIFNISQINLLGTTTQDNIHVHLGDMTQLGQANVTSDTFELPSIMTPIRRINGRIANGWLTYSGGSGTDIADFNPAVLATPVVAQTGMQTVMAHAFQHAYEHTDWYTKFPAEKRFAMLSGTPHATNELAKGGSYDKLDLSNPYEDHWAIWLKSYATFEDMPLRPGPKVDVNSYGSLVGIDSSFQDWGRDWYGVTTGYIGYNGAHMDYPEVKSSLDGGLFGITQTLYKNNFWSGVTAHVGTSFVDTRTMYGRENSTLFATGFGTQTGYNIELGDGNFIIQPIWLMNYSMIKTFDYTSAAGVKIDPKPLHTVQLNPTLRLVGNVKGWQPYAAIGMVWNLMGKTHVMADSVELPEMSVKPYMRYDVGVQKAIGDRFTGFIQAMGYNGGRNGIDIVGGIRWAFGKGGKNSVAKMNNDIPHTTVNKNMQKVQAEEPVVTVEEIYRKQEDIPAAETVAKGQKIIGKPQSVTISEPVVNEDMDKEPKDTTAEKPLVQTQALDEKRPAIQTEEPITETQNSNNWMKWLIVCGIVLLLIMFMHRGRRR